MANDTARKIEQLTDAIEAHGYCVAADPIPGSEHLFLAELEIAFAKIEETMAFAAKHYGYRGRSKNALAHLHHRLPEPVWAVEVAAK